MSDLTYAVLSFFKEHKHVFDYVFNPKNKQIKFMCISCFKNAIIYVETGYWTCPNCGSNGTIKNLYEAANSGCKIPYVRIEDPRRSDKEIKMKLNKLLKRYSDDEDLKSIYNLYVNLITQIENDDYTN